MATDILINAHRLDDLYLYYSISVDLWNQLEGMVSVDRGRRLGTR